MHAHAEGSGPKHFGLKAQMGQAERELATNWRRVNHSSQEQFGSFRDSHKFVNRDLRHDGYNPQAIAGVQKRMRTQTQQSHKPKVDDYQEHEEPGEPGELKNKKSMRNTVYGTGFMDTRKPAAKKASNPSPQVQYQSAMGPVKLNLTMSHFKKQDYADA